MKIFRKKFFLLFFLALILLPNLVLAGGACTAPSDFFLNTKDFSFWVVTFMAFVDSINPCAIAVMLLLLSALVFFDNRKKIFFSGIAFILGLYITYFIFGMGLFCASDISKYINPTIIHKAIGIFGIIIGLLNIKDFFWYGGGGFVMEIPRRLRPRMSLIIAKATSVPVAFFTGMLVTLFELPCTGGPYLFTVGALSTKEISTFMRVIILLYYNVIFVIPLIIILLGVYVGFINVSKAEQWKERNLRLLHLIAGIILLGLGLWVFLS